MTENRLKPSKSYLPKGKRIWVLFQDTNGDESSKRYCFWFDSRKKAQEYRAHVVEQIQSGTPWCAVSVPKPFVLEAGPVRKTVVQLTAKPCEAEIWHGPGHQSRSRCEKKGPHKQHAVYSREFFWSEKGTKKKPVFTGFFNNSPEEDRGE